MFMSLKALVPILYVPRHDADKKNILMVCLRVLY